jgi:hypothetical protein
MLDGDIATAKTVPFLPLRATTGVAVPTPRCGRSAIARVLTLPYGFRRAMLAVEWTVWRFSGIAFLNAVPGDVRVDDDTDRAELTTSTSRAFFIQMAFPPLAAILIELKKCQVTFRAGFAPERVE